MDGGQRTDGARTADGGRTADRQLTASGPTENGWRTESGQPQLLAVLKSLQTCAACSGLMMEAWQCPPISLSISSSLITAKQTPCKLFPALCHHQRFKIEPKSKAEWHTGKTARKEKCEAAHGEGKQEKKKTIGGNKR